MEQQIKEHESTIRVLQCLLQVLENYGANSLEEMRSRVEAADFLVKNITGLKANLEKLQAAKVTP